MGLNPSVFTATRLHLTAQGCRAPATLGICHHNSSTPTGLCPLPESTCHSGRNPVGVNYTTALPPRVAAARQPFALLRNPVGINISTATRFYPSARGWRDAPTLGITRPAIINPIGVGSSSGTAAPRRTQPRWVRACRHRHPCASAGPRSPGGIPTVPNAQRRFQTRETGCRRGGGWPGG